MWTPVIHKLRFLMRHFQPLSMLVCLATFLLAADTVHSANWPQFRGPLGTGESTEAAVPVQWSSPHWRVKLPVRGHSSPVIWENKIFLTGWTNAGDKVDRHVLCVDRENGKVLWQQKAATGSGERLHKMNSWATPSCATDGTHVVAFFGDGGLHCYTVDGKPVWSRDLGNFPGNWGVGASPIFHGNTVIQNCDAEGDSYLLAVDKSTGKDVWKTPRKSKPRGGWSTPILIKTKARTELVVNGEYGVQSYNPDDGKPLWFCKSFNGRGTPVPVWGHGLVYVVNGKPGDIYAIEPDGDGDVTESHMKWHTKRGGGRDLPSPVLSGKTVVAIGMQGIATGYNASSGAELWKKRLGGNFSGSPIVANGHVYAASESGEVIVMKAAEELEIVARNTSELGSQDDTVRSSLALSNGQIFMRSDQCLFCFAK